MQDAVRAVATVGPPASVSSLYLLGATLPDWVLIITLVLALANLFVLIRDKFVLHYLQRRKERHEQQDDGK